MQSFFACVAIVLLSLHLPFLSAIELKTTKQYVAETQSPDDKLQLVCTGLNFDNSKPVYFYNNEIEIFNTYTNVTDFDGVERINGTAIALSQNFTKVGGVRNAKCKYDNIISSPILYIPYISTPKLVVSPEKFKLDANFDVTCSVKVFPASITNYSVTFTKETKEFGSWNKVAGANNGFYEWKWLNGSAFTGGWVVAGQNNPQQTSFSAVVKAKGKEAAGKWACIVALISDDKKTTLSTFHSNVFTNSGALVNGLSIAAVAFVALLSVLV